jgi:hypothetical protein
MMGKLEVGNKRWGIGKWEIENGRLEMEKGK